MRKSIIRIFILIGLFYLISNEANSQIIDNYGISIGVGLSNQYWTITDEDFERTYWKDKKCGVNGRLFIEKRINNHILLQPGIGYIQKGFVEDVTFYFNNEEVTTNQSRVTLHDLSIDMAVKISIFESKIKPHIIIGLRGDYLLDYNDVVINLDGEELSIHSNTIDNYNKITIGALIGIGISYNETYFINFEYNPAITKNYNTSTYKIHDNYWSLSFGVNVNKLIKKMN